jgi:hypothetical protein
MHANSYGAADWETSDNLIVNNTVQHVATPVLIGTTAGTVVAYNYATDNFYAFGGWMAGF